MKFKTYATIGVATLLMLAGSVCQSVTRWIDGGIYSVAIAFADSGTEDNPNGAQPNAQNGSNSNAQSNQGASNNASPSGAGQSDNEQPAAPSKRNYINVPGK